MQIVNLFYQLARQHRFIRGFAYGKGYEKGAGNKAYPLIWLDDPVSGRRVNNCLSWTCNVDFLDIPKNDNEVPLLQRRALANGLAFAERLKVWQRTLNGLRLDGFTFISLRDYYDDNAAGFRFTYTLIQPIPLNLCTNYFDPNGLLSCLDGLPDFVTENSCGCAVFKDKTGLPEFTISPTAHTGRGAKKGG